MSARSEKPKKSPVEERRTSTRTAIVSGGKITYGRHHRSMYCVVLDISDDGARLVPANILVCPNMLSLKVGDQPARDCKVVWRRKTQMGVKFVVKPGSKSRPKLR